MLDRCSRGLVPAVCAIALLGAGTALAGTPPPYPGEWIGAGTLPSGYQMASADLNGDGLPDIVVADDAASSTSPPAGGVWVFLAQMGGGYAAPVFYATPCSPLSLALGDLGNGQVDIVAANSCSASADQVSVLIGNGDGTFKAAVNYSPDTTASVHPGSITIGDATGDGKPDVVVGNKDTTTTYVIPGNGDGTLDTSAVQKLTVSHIVAYGVIVTDLNHDGYPDVVVADGCSVGTAGAVDVFLGTASGTFGSTPSQTVTVGSCPEFGVNNDALIGSTDPDVAVANDFDGTYQILSNSAGTLTAGTPVNLPAGACPYWIHVADVDGDGNPDLIMSDPCSDSVDIAYGQSGGGFSAPVFVPVGYHGYDVAAVRVAAGTDLVALDYTDSAGLVVAQNMGNRIFYSYRDYPYQNGSAQGQKASDMVMVDLNGDGLRDAVVANSGDSTLSTLLNNGDGTFGAPNVMTPGGAGIFALARSNCGSPCVVTADNGGHLYAYVSKGDGTFQAPVTSAIAPSTVDGIAVADLNHDSYPDAIVSERTANQVQICKGNGTGNFDCSAFSPIFVQSPHRVLETDVNGDGNPDLVVTSGHPDATVSGDTDAYVYLGNGDGTFALSATLPVAGTAWGIAYDDFNGDGKTDLVFGSSTGNKVSVFMGNGNGTFSASATYVSGYIPKSVAALADVNQDGRDDFIVGNEGDSTLSIFINKGDGTFNKENTYAAGQRVSVVRSFDETGNGLPDIVTANYGDANLMNSNVGVYLHDAPPVVMGTSLTTNKNTSVTGSVSVEVSSPYPLTFAVASQPSHGTVKIQASTGNFTYTPSMNFTGSDSFTVTATDGLETSAPATVDITVKAVSSGGGGGGFGLLGLLALSGLAMRRRRRAPGDAPRNGASSRRVACDRRFR